MCASRICYLVLSKWKVVKLVLLIQAMLYRKKIPSNISLRICFCDQEYVEDGIDWAKVEFEDNQHCLNLFEKV